MTDVSPDGLPDIVILGVGHSGTSLLAKLLFTLGWEVNDADETFCESTGMRAINNLYRSGEASAQADARAQARAFITSLRSPFALKDPRLTFTLPLWAEAFQAQGRNPVLLQIHRNRERLAKSYTDRGELYRGEAGMYGRTLDQLIEAAEANFAKWPFHKTSLRYEDIVAAGRLVRGRRFMRQEGGLWKPGPRT